MAKGPTPRQVARAENIQRIKELALSQLADAGAGELSLRAIARELNIVSSAIYRYFPSRDDLITALIIDAYDSLAVTLERAGAADRRGPRRRWLDTARAWRAWAREEPHRFALVYGSAIPGYAAPQDTVAPAGRVLRAFVAPVLASHVVDQRPTTHVDAVPLRPAIRTGLRTQLRTTAEALELDLPDHVVLGLIGAFVRVIGTLTLELNGHFVGGFEPADELFEAFLEREADQFGL